MYAPLIAGFIVFVLIAVVIGYLVDPDRQGKSEHDSH